jgi:hypothetical protein
MERVTIESNVRKSGCRKQRKLFCEEPLVVLVADDAGDLPLAVFKLPEGDELGVSNTIFGVVEVGETVNADLDCAVVLERVDFKGREQEGALDFSADVLLDCGDKRRFADGETSLVVVKLQVVGDHRAEGGQVAVVVGVKEFGVEGVDGFKKRVSLRGRLGSRLGLRMSDGGEGENEQKGENEYAFKTHGKPHKVLRTFERVGSGEDSINRLLE